MQNELERWPELISALRLIQPEEPYAILENIKKQADAGDPEAQALLVQEFYRGDIARHDHTIALQELEKALQTRHPLALYFHAYNLEVGIDGTPRGIEDSMAAWDRARISLEAAKNPSGHILDALTMIYSSGKGSIEVDYEKAWDYCQQACESDFPQPWARRAWFYENGKGGAPQSFSKAFQAYQKASRLGSTLANHHLARCYLDGIGGEKNREMALGYLARSALKGVPRATKDLENILDKGLNFLGDAPARVLVANSAKTDFRFEIGERVHVDLPDQPGATWAGTIVERRKKKYRIKIDSVIPGIGRKGLAPCPCTGQEVITEIDSGLESKVTHAWVPENCATKQG